MYGWRTPCPQPTLLVVVITSSETSKNSASQVCWTRFYSLKRGKTTIVVTKEGEKQWTLIFKLICIGYHVHLQPPEPKFLWHLTQFSKRVKSTNSHLPTWMQKSPRMVPGLESAGLVSPSITRPVFTTFSPSQTSKDKRKHGQGRKLISEENLKTRNSEKEKALFRGYMITFIPWINTGNTGLPAPTCAFYNPFLTLKPEWPFENTQCKTFHSFPTLKKYRANTALPDLAPPQASELISSNLLFHPLGFIHYNLLLVLQ